VKRLFAILFSVLLAWMPFLPAPAAASALPACPKHTPGNAVCDASCGMAGCCVKKPDSNSQPAPAIPAQTSNQISLLFSATVIWTLPENESGSFSSTATSSLTMASAPLYARNCARLL